MLGYLSLHGHYYYYYFLNLICTEVFVYFFTLIIN